MCVVFGIVYRLGYAHTSWATGKVNSHNKRFGRTIVVCSHQNTVRSSHYAHYFEISGNTEIPSIDTLSLYEIVFPGKKPAQ